MTYFEEFAKELGVKITVDKNGFYTGKCKALASVTNEIILSDDEKVFNMSWEEQKKIITNRFYSIFPYMRKEA